MGGEEGHLEVKTLLLFSHSVVSNFFVTPWTAARQASLSFTIPSLFKLISVELVMPSNHLSFCCPLLLLLSIFLRSESFPMSQLFTSGGRSVEASASAPVLPMNIQG